MQKYLKAILPCMVILNVHAQQALPSDFIKVSKENNPQCVEYYNYKGDVYCRLKAATVKPLAVNVWQDERQNIVFDERAWVAAWGKKTPAIITIEYIPQGETIHDWNELVTTQFLPGIQEKLTLKEFFASVVNTLKNTGLNPSIHLLSQTPTDVIFEFRIDSPPNLAQDEIQKITQGKEGFYILHYVIKQPDMGEQHREKWLRIIQSSVIKE
ncbi:hypothetical protein [Legionella oakridgensis]|uniref:Uncharacterized protein n=2 Tax=Legionella oakridgensis TaxID=29423 RepID=W0BHD9_9GAMM|nr:hypothetical protein [Legionella oakridgensis]AHE68052.1 hypothetical protein Loa_02515 [Legionella oakridgensis ATCC 33761 = DSM 21215]ETO92475.1 hypothetical protein LOR_65c18330 [Legionella oakridgensis RV-2-2007]KTD44550.1 hypothetical protein Loak_0061 [Legionella oakridgensis]STY21039.1 Uncharacterised protein [Legionella longbeachae]